ncbi:MAG: hypothetical protein ACOYL6_09725 [Bacteriovoracaceae bacterium]
MELFKLLLFLVCVPAFAGLNHAPQSFAYKNGKAVFVDFEEANYKLTYNGATQVQTVAATIKFESFEDGYPIFDLVKDPTSVKLDGVNIGQSLVRTPDNATSVRILAEMVKAGVHTLEVSAPLTQTVRYTPQGVNSAFWFSDLDDRSYLEAYAPANYEFDQVKMTFDIEFLNLKDQTFYTNGKLTKISENKYHIDFPAYFTCSSLFFHTAPVGRYPEAKTIFKSLDGRDIPITLYSTNSSPKLEQMKNNALATLKELENDYGNFPHQTLVIFEAGSGGMEYCGATMTDAGSLSHELTHSYFARGIMPANGNAGWLDEAIASWRDKRYPQSSSMPPSTQMASHTQYTRMTDRAAYTRGATFMAYLDKKIKDQGKGGLKLYLAHLVETQLFSPLVTEEFSKMMTEFTGVEVKADFDRVAYGKAPVRGLERETHPLHTKMSLKDYQDLLK